LVNAFACQQLSLVVGVELLNRLAVVCGVRQGSGSRSHYGVPTPDDVGPMPAWCISICCSMDCPRPECSNQRPEVSALAQARRGGAT
jgi:hypothetical protein